MMSSSSVTTEMTASIASSFLERISSRASAWAMVRGKPSRINPLEQSSFVKRSSTILIVTESGTSAPASIYVLASCPKGVPFFMFSRKISPVEMCAKPYVSFNTAQAVPFPDPGAPKIISLISKTSYYLKFLPADLYLLFFCFSPSS